jgi:hypothetical protein
MNEFELRRALADLPRQRAPTRDLWPGIASRLDTVGKTSRTPRWTWLALAAAAVLAVALLPAQLGRIGETADPVPMQAAAPAPVWPQGEAIMVGSAWSLPAWVLADAEVSAAVTELEESTAELHHLIREHPRNAHLVTLLHAHYEQHRWLNRFGVGQSRPLHPQET